jgi:myosin heavy subunit
MVPPNSPKGTNPQKTGTPQTTPTQKSSSSSPAPPPIPPKKKSSGALVPILVGLGVIMLLAVAWLSYTSMIKARALEQKIALLEESEKVRQELENQYNEAIAELDALKGDNEQINALIDQQKAELAAQKNEIGRLLRDKRKLDAARAQIAELKTTVANSIAEIEQLQAEQEMLAQQNLLLLDEKDSLTATLQMKASENQELSKVKAKLVSETKSLSKSVEVGSVVLVKKVKVTGQKLRKGGKASDRDKAKKVDQLKVCFTTVVNDLVQPGTEQFFIRIINPNGETLAIDDLGSGTMMNSKSGERVEYTQVKEYDYSNDEADLCFLWNPNTPFDSGQYDVEIYNKGYLAGTGSFELK